MTVKAKRFRIGVEGATTDGREIQREWLVQMAASYNPTVYTALINLEHIKSYLPESTFNRYGRVTGLVAEEIQDGPLAGKMALYADIEPTDALVELVKKARSFSPPWRSARSLPTPAKPTLWGWVRRTILRALAPKCWLSAPAPHIIRWQTVSRTLKTCFRKLSKR